MALFFEVLFATLLSFLLIIGLAALFRKSYEACRKAEAEAEAEAAEKEKDLHTVSGDEVQEEERGSSETCETE